MVIVVPLLVCLIGMVLYVLPVDGKVQALGKDMFWVGLLVFLLLYPQHPVTIGR